MFTAEDIQRITNKKTYAKGLDLYEMNKIIAFSYETDEVLEMDGINAMVKGSGRNIYDVDIDYDYVNDDIVECSCECPAFSSYPGFCKHIVATLLQYIDVVNDVSYDYNVNPEGLDIDDFNDVLTKIMGEKTNVTALNPYRSSSGQLPQKKATSPEVSRLLTAKDDYQFRPLFNEDAPAAMVGKVVLEPHFSLSFREVSLSFKIGAERLYVLKDIREFCYRVDRNLPHSYGKQLSFTHSMDAFEPQSREMVKLLMKKVDAKKSGRYYYSDTIKREITLTVDEFVEFIQLMGSRPVKIDGYPYYGEQVYTVSDRPLERRMTITKRDQGIDVAIERIEGLAGVANYVYFVDGSIYVVETNSIGPIKDFLAMMAGKSDRKVYIANEDTGAFFRQLLPVLRNHYSIDMTNINPDEYAIEQGNFSMYLDLPEKDVVTCRVKVCYGDKEMYLFENVHRNIRDSALERRVNQGISAYFSGYDSRTHELYLEGSENRLYKLLTEGLPELASYGEIYISDRLKKINVVSHAPIQVGVSVESGLLDLHIESQDLTPNQLAEILTKYSPKKKYYRLRNGDFIDVKGSDLENLHELTESLVLTEKEINAGRIQLPKFRALYVDEQLKKSLGGSVARNKDFKALIRSMKTVEENDYDVPDSLDGILRGYQVSGFLWMNTLRDNGFGGILADDMGLGKTLQVIAFLKRILAMDEKCGKTLIVSPSSLVYNWRNEFEKFAPEMPVVTVTGSPAVREQIICGSDHRDILITSYDLLKRDRHLYDDITFACQIIDEAQYIKNSNTKAAKAVKSVQASFKLALTGTPIENRLSELWSIFDYLMPGFLYSYKKFKSDIEQAMVQQGDGQVADRLRRMVSPFILRRLKKDVLTDLPDKIEENVLIPLGGEQRKVYDARVALLRKDLRKQTSEEFRTSKIKVLSELTRLRQLCCDPALVYENYDAGSSKTDMCMALVQEAVDGGHKVLLFSQFTSVLHRLIPILEENGISYLSLTGSTSKEQRISLVDRFNADDTSVFCISLKAGGTGLNLTSADIVIHFDPWWNVSAQNQATDRAHRIGQRNVVNVYKLIAKDSIEEKILQMQERKQALADEVLSGEGIATASFSKEELLEILS